MVFQWAKKQEAHLELKVLIQVQDNINKMVYRKLSVTHLALKQGQFQMIRIEEAFLVLELIMRIQELGKVTMVILVVLELQKDWTLKA